MRTRLFTWLAAATVATVGACSSSAHRAAPRHSSRPASTTTHVTTQSSTRPTATSTTTTTALDTAATHALRAHLVDSIAGYALQPAGQSGTGPSSLDAAASDQGGAATERAALRDAGYRAGYKLLFSSGDRQILLLAYRFATAAGAQKYADRAFAARVHDGGTTAATAPVGVPGARLIDRSEPDAAAALVVFTRGATLVILSTIQPPNTDAAALIDPIAAEQYARLAGY